MHRLALWSHHRPILAANGGNFASFISRLRPQAMVSTTPPSTRKAAPVVARRAETQGSRIAGAQRYATPSIVVLPLMSHPATPGRRTRRGPRHCLRAAQRPGQDGLAKAAVANSVRVGVTGSYDPAEPASRFGVGRQPPRPRQGQRSAMHRLPYGKAAGSNTGTIRPSFAGRNTAHTLASICRSSRLQPTTLVSITGPSARRT